jgi:hypothetical protein
MPNAKDITSASQTGMPKFLLTGSPGSGKTTQALTLPGRTFAYLFDPSSLSSLRGHDIDYEMFVPSVVSLAVRSLKKDVGDPIKRTIIDADKIYTAWEKDFEDKISSKYFEKNDITNMLFDSFTTFGDIVMDRVQAINGRTGQWPQQDDWTAQMNTIRNVVRTITGQMNLTLVCTGHERTLQDELTKRIINEVMLTGQLKAKLPLLFSDIWHMEVSMKDGKPRYTAQTIPDKLNPTCRTSFRGLEQFVDVTIENWKTPTVYGIGKLMKAHGLV